MTTPSGHVVMLPPEQQAMLEAYLASQAGGAASPELAHRIVGNVAAQPQGNPYMQYMPAAQRMYDAQAAAAQAPNAVLLAPGMPSGGGFTTNVPTPMMRAEGMREPQGEDPHAGPERGRVVGRAAAEDQMRAAAKRHVDALMKQIGAARNAE